MTSLCAKTLLRTTRLTNAPCKACVAAVPSISPVFIQVRFRKPKGMPRAPSKGPEYFAKTYPTMKDIKLGTPVYESYNTAIMSISAGLQEKRLHKHQSLSNEIEIYTIPWDEEAHHEKCMKYNETENKRLEEIKCKQLEIIKARQQKHNEQQIQNVIERELEQEKAEAELLKEVELESVGWVTLENIETRVAEAIDNPINVNFAVDKKGMVIKRTAQRLWDENEEPEPELQRESQ